MSCHACTWNPRWWWLCARGPCVLFEKHPDSPHKQLVAAHINFNSLRGGTVGTCSQQAPRAVGRCIVCFTRGLQPTACVWQITHSAACMHCCLARCSIGSQNGPYTILPRLGLKLHSDCSCELWVCHGSLF